MASDSPFFVSRIECPICKSINELQTVRVGAYTEQGRDTDFCPTEIEWRYKRYQNHNPLLYFTATCSNCFYTREFNNSFKEWKKDSNFITYRLKSIKPQHLDQLAQAGSALKLMGEAVEAGGHPNESAILKLHLAVYDELLADHVSNLDLGRFYLRIGWVFRSMNRLGNPATQTLVNMTADIDNHFAGMDSALESFSKEMRALERHWQAQFDSSEIPSEIKAQMIPYKEPVESGVKGCREVFSEMEVRLNQLAQALNEYKGSVLEGQDGVTGAGFAGRSSFVDFLKEIRQTWDGVAINERTALEKAVSYYQAAFSDGRDISPGYQQLQASYLIAELSRRIGDFDGARQYFNSTIKYGQDFIYRNRNDRSRTALARKILELAIEQGRANMEALKTA